MQQQRVCVMSLLAESAAQLDLVVFDESVSVYTAKVSISC